METAWRSLTAPTEFDKRLSIRHLSSLSEANLYVEAFALTDRSGGATLLLTWLGWRRLRQTSADGRSSDVAKRLRCTRLSALVLGSSWQAGRQAGTGNMDGRCIFWDPPTQASGDTLAQPFEMLGRIQPTPPQYDPPFWFANLGDPVFRTSENCCFLPIKKTLSTLLALSSNSRRGDFSTATPTRPRASRHGTKPRGRPGSASRQTPAAKTDRHGEPSDQG